VSQTNASVRWAVKDSWLLISTPYNQAFVARIKEDIAPGMRAWDKAKRLWKVEDTPNHRSIVRTILADVFDVDMEDPEDRNEGPGFTSPGAAKPKGGGNRYQTGAEGQWNPSPEARELATLKVQLAAAHREEAHLNAVIRSLNADLATARRMSRFGGGGEGVLEKILRDDALGTKAFRKLSMVLHPDTGGDVELFKELEQAWDKAEKRRGNR
jgi:hypothetical protein